MMRIVPPWRDVLALVLDAELLTSGELVKVVDAAAFARPPLLTTSPKGAI